MMWRGILAEPRILNIGDLVADTLQINYAYFYYGYQHYS